jgi:hypothetical protein
MLQRGHPSWLPLSRGRTEFHIGAAMPSGTAAAYAEAVRLRNAQKALRDVLVEVPISRVGR